MVVVAGRSTSVDLHVAAQHQAGSSDRGWKRWTVIAILTATGAGWISGRGRTRRPSRRMSGRRASRGWRRRGTRRRSWGTPRCTARTSRPSSGNLRQSALLSGGKGQVARRTSSGGRGGGGVQSPRFFMPEGKRLGSPTRRPVVGSRGGTLRSQQSSCTTRG